MIYLEYFTRIRRPMEEVFKRLTNIDAYNDWLPKSRVFLECHQTSEGPVGQGTTLVDKTRVGTYHGEVTEFEEPTKVQFRMTLRWLGARVMESRPTYLLESANGVTEVRHIAEGRLFGLFKVLEPYVRIRARQERQRTLDFLRKSLEMQAE